MAHLALLRLRVGVVLVHSLDRVDKAEAQGLTFNLLVREEGQVLGGLHVRNVLGSTLGEDDINLLERSVGGLWVEEPDDRKETGVDYGEEEIGSPADSVDPVGFASH